MDKRREQKRIEAKIRAMENDLRGFSATTSRIEKKIKIEFTRMINFLLFYKYKDKWDKWGHVFEVICFYIILQFAVKGILGR